MAATHFDCPRCSRRLQKSAQAFVMGWAGIKPPKDEGFPATVTCPGCGYAIPTAAMLAGDFDPKFDWVIAAAVAAGLAAYLLFRLGYGLGDVKSFGAGLVVTFLILGASDLLTRLRR